MSSNPTRTNVISLSKNQVLHPPSLVLAGPRKRTRTLGRIKWAMSFQDCRAENYWYRLKVNRISGIGHTRTNILFVCLLWCGFFIYSYLHVHVTDPDILIGWDNIATSQSLTSVTYHDCCLSSGEQLRRGISRRRHLVRNCTQRDFTG